MYGVLKDRACSTGAKDVKRHQAKALLLRGPAVQVGRQTGTGNSPEQVGAGS